MFYRWAELCQRAEGVPFRHPALNAKDNARFQVRRILFEMTGYDIEKSECPEEEIEKFLNQCNEYDKFDERGNLI